MLEQLPNLILWAILWSAYWGVFLWLFFGGKIDYIRKFLWTSAYFLLVAGLTAIVFQDQLRSVRTALSEMSLLVFGIVAVVNVLLYSYFPKYVKEPAEFFQHHPGHQFFKIDLRRLFSKAIDILAQQLGVIVLTVILRDAGLNLGQIILSFTLIFGVLHMPLLFFQRDQRSAWYFTLFSAAGGAIFPTLILTLPSGFVYSYIVHWLFYTFTAVGFWILYPALKKRRIVE